MEHLVSRKRSTLGPTYNNNVLSGMRQRLTIIHVLLPKIVIELIDLVSLLIVFIKCLKNEIDNS